MKKDVLVIGLGRFGKSVAYSLSKCGHNVLAIDKNKEDVEEVADYVETAMCADASDEEVLNSLDVSSFDCAVIGMSTNLEDSVMVTILLKELKVPYILVKAQTELHGKILKKVGADKIVYPEAETGTRVANNLIYGNFFNDFLISPIYGISEIEPLNDWVNNDIRTIDFRKKYNINILGIKRNGEVHINPMPDEKILENDILYVVATNEMISNLIKQKREENDNI